MNNWNWLCWWPCRCWFWWCSWHYGHMSPIRVGRTNLVCTLITMHGFIPYMFEGLRKNHPNSWCPALRQRIFPAGPFHLQFRGALCRPGGSHQGVSVRQFASSAIGPVVHGGCQRSAKPNGPNYTSRVCETRLSILQCNLPLIVLILTCGSEYIWFLLITMYKGLYLYPILFGFSHTTK